MPINIPSKLYTGGTYAFDTSPMTNAILKDLASQKAAKEAIVKNAKNLAFKLNPAGLRKDVDLPEFNKRATEWYKNAVAGNLDYGKYQELLNDIEVGKKRVETIAKSGELALNRKIEMDANDVAVLENLNKSIYDPTSRKADGNEFGLGDLSPSIPEFNPTEQSQAFAVASSKAKPTYNETKARIDNVTGKVFIPKEFKEEDVKSIAEGYGNLALGNRKIEKHYNNLRKSQEFMAEADLAYKSVYGQNANITTAAEAAKADAIMKARLAGEEVEVTDPNYANELKIKLKKTIPGKAPSAPRAGAAQLPPQQNILESYTQSYALPATLNINIPAANLKKGDKAKIVYTDQISITDLPIIQGTDLNRGILGNKPFNMGGGRTAYIVTDGGWVGQSGLIDKQAVLDRQIKEAGTQATKIGSQGARGGQLPQTPPPAAPKKGKEDKFKLGF